MPAARSACLSPIIDSHVSQEAKWKGANKILKDVLQLMINSKAIVQIMPQPPSPGGLRE